MKAAATSALAALLSATAAAAVVGHARAASAGTHELHAALRLASQLGACPPGVTANTCASRTAEGVVPGLGHVTETYAWVADIGVAPCAEGFGRTHGYPVRWVVAGKGELFFRPAEATECVDQEALRTQTQSFTVTGGTGIYAGAAGSGTVERSLGGATPTGRVGTETWQGTLVVPGLEFDVTPPAIAAPAAKTVRAPRGARRVRVVYNVTAHDDVDATVPVTCKPRSGTRFRLGRTVVSCSATDSSGNTQTVRFTVTVKPRR